ncbi:MAG TPA: type II toxin-antitoxin system HicB family antitoxin [Planctomycetota bacterium]|jgi:predicted RNase H-like HicB family nuclease
MRARAKSKKAQRIIKIIVEKHPDCYIAYPLGLRGGVVGQGDTYEEALADVKSAIKGHVETFGEEAFEDFDDESPVEVFVAETGVRR